MQYQEDSDPMEQVYILHYQDVDGKQISYACPPGVETDHLSQFFQSVSSQDVDRARIAGDYVFVLMQPFAHDPDEDDTTAAVTTEVYFVPLGEGQAISVDRIRVAILDAFGPEVMDVDLDSLRVYGNAAGDCKGKGKIITNHAYRVQQSCM